MIDEIIAIRLEPIGESLLRNRGHRRLRQQLRRRAVIPQPRRGHAEHVPIPDAAEIQRVAVGAERDAVDAER